MRTTRLKYAVAVLTGTAVLAACGTESGDHGRTVGDGGAKTTTDTTDIAGIRWVPQKVTVDGKEYTLPTDDENPRLDDAHITIRPGKAEPDIAGDDTGGTVGCNHFGAAAALDGDTLKITDLASTAMACHGPVQKFEQRFLSVFDGTLKIAVEERDGTKTLTLTSTDGDSITLSEGTAEPAPALKGTRWTIDTLISGKGDDGTARSLPKGVKAHLTLAADGTASGSLGCNTFRGKATVKDGTIAFGPLATTRKVCAGPEMKTERELIDILAGKVSYQQEQRNLTLTAASGQGLSARAK